MNTATLKSYAQAARRDFLQAITDRAAQLGISANSIATVPHQTTGAVVIEGTAFPVSILAPRKVVVDAIERDGFRAVIEQVAYTWFNRLVALRFMEIHGYLDHGLRILSNPGGGAVPEIVARLRDLDLPTLDKTKAIELAMAGNQDEALYRLILLAQCRHLAIPMPWLFETHLHEGLDLLLPEHLLATDSVIRKLVNEIPEDDWKNGVEIIGWLYQFFISERKDEVIGSVVAPQDIPAATQLFTPNWIVQYLVQNSLGRLWLESHPESGLRQFMPYYIEPAQQDPEVQTQLDALVQRGRSPESLTVLDPACGSGHILVEAFRLLYQIYLEQGHREREIPRLIFANNLFGLDIDDRAAQLACLALLFEARRHDRRIFVEPPPLNVLSIQQSVVKDKIFIDEIVGFSAQTEAKILIDLFTQAKTFGSLLRIPANIRALLPAVQNALQNVKNDYYWKADLLEKISPLVKQAEVMARQYEVVVANPPYMGGKGMTKSLKDFAKDEYPRSKSDAFAMFIERGFEMVVPAGFNAMVTMQSWMFLSSYEDMRKELLEKYTITCMGHMDNGVMGIAFGTAATVIRKHSCPNSVSSYSYTTMENIGSDNKPIIFPTPNERLKNTRQSDFAKIPGMPLAYWVEKSILNIFADNPQYSTICAPKVGLQTGSNDLFLRYWWEVNIQKTAIQNGSKWFLYNKGGERRSWYGNREFVVDWENNGERIKNFKDSNGKQLSRPQNTQFYFRESITWPYITSGGFSARYSPMGSIFDVNGASSFPSSDIIYQLLALLNSSLIQIVSKIINPTLSFQSGDMERVPVSLEVLSSQDLKIISIETVQFSKFLWDSKEISWDFLGFKLLKSFETVSEFFSSKATFFLDYKRKIENNEITIDKIIFQVYKIPSDIIPHDHSVIQIPDKDELTYFLLSYSLGCMMGRYSIDHPGLIYANAGNVGFDHGKYPSFPADDDGIVPITDEAWFSDDATERFVQFVGAAWPKEHLEENLSFVAEALDPKQDEKPRDTIRRYFSDQFYKDHCQTYKKRPIYWKFSSGKHKAFECLIYLHRYNPEMLGRMRSEYVIPLQGKLQGRQTALTQEIASATSTAQRKQAQKALDTTEKKIRELATFDDQLRNFADQKIPLDLDDGVKVNIRKFGTLIDLAPVGGSDE